MKTSKESVTIVINDISQSKLILKELDDFFGVLPSALRQFETNSVTKGWNLLTNYGNIESTTPESSIIQVTQDLSSPLVSILDKRQLNEPKGKFGEQLSLFSQNSLDINQVVSPHVAQSLSPFIVIGGILENLRDKKINIDNLHWRQLEEIVADLLQKDGYNVQLTPPSNDGGADVIATKEIENIGFFKGVWQAKKYSINNHVGIAEIRQLADTRREMKATKGYIVTTSRLTRKAQERIKRDYCILGKVERNELQRWIDRVLKEK